MTDSTFRPVPHPTGENTRNPACPAWAVPQRETPDEGVDLEGYLKSRQRKSTACGSELEFCYSGDGSQPEDLTCQTDSKRPSLLASLKCPASLGRFERVVLEDSEIEEDGRPSLGKRSVNELSSIPEYTSPKFGRFHSQQPHQLVDQAVPDFSLRPESTGVSSCRLNHRMLRADPYSTCQICWSLVSTIRRCAEEKGYRLLSEELDLEVQLGCAQGHEWTVCHKKAAKSSCRDCKKKRKQVLKEMLEEETQRKNEERRQKQERLLHEARLRMQTGEQLSREEQKRELDSFKIILEEITRIASKYAREYCQKDSTVDFNQVLLLYQTLIIPEKNLNTHFQSLSKDELKKEFRRYTILLHPDKNSHPKAKQAFQKAFSLFSGQSANNS